MIGPVVGNTLKIGATGRQHSNQARGRNDVIELKNLRELDSQRKYTGSSKVKASIYRNTKTANTKTTLEQTLVKKLGLCKMEAKNLLKSKPHAVRTAASYESEKNAPTYIHDIKDK